MGYFSVPLKYRPTGAITLIYERINISLTAPKGAQNRKNMNHYVKIAGAVAVGILGAKFVEAGIKRAASAVANAAARVASDNNETEDAPNAEAPKPEVKKPETKAPDKKDGQQGKKDDKKPADGKQDNNGKKGDKKPEAAGKK
jgi:hypothetical protein